MPPGGGPFGFCIVGGLDCYNWEESGKYSMQMREKEGAAAAWSSENEESGRECEGESWHLHSDLAE